MSKNSFPEIIDVEPTHTVDDDLTEVLDWGEIIRGGLLFRNDLGAMYYMYVTKSYNIPGFTEHMPQWEEAKVGTVPWGILYQNGYNVIDSDIQGYIYHAAKDDAYSDLNEFRTVMCRPVIAIYENMDLSQPAHTKITGLYKFSPASLRITWPLGHGVGLIEYSFTVQQTSQESIVINADGSNYAVKDKYAGIL